MNPLNTLKSKLTSIVLSFVGVFGLATFVLKFLSGRNADAAKKDVADASKADNLLNVDEDKDLYKSKADQATAVQQSNQADLHIQQADQLQKVANQVKPEAKDAEDNSWKADASGRIE